MGKKWKLVVTLALTLLGAGILLYGVVASRWPATVAGAILVLSFGHAAAGARKVEAGASKDSVQVKADYTEPPPPTQHPRETGLILPPEVDPPTRESDH